MSPGTEFVRDFCAGIGPLQLGVVFVYYLFNTLEQKCSNLENHIKLHSKHIDFWLLFYHPV